MAQLTIYMDDESLRRIEDAATREKSSVSGWVKARLLESLDDRWPTGYFELMGALGQDDLQRPPQPEASFDTPREPL